MNPPLGQLQKPLQWPQTPKEEDAMLVNLKEEQGFPWGEIMHRFPQRSFGVIQVHYSTKLKERVSPTYR